MAGGVAPPELAALKTWLLDTGPVIAYLDSGDLEHDAVVVCIDGFTGRFATTSAVITEVMHFVAAEKGGPRLLAEFLLSTGTKVHDLLAEGIDAHDILTLDRRGFRTYRTRRRRAFRLALDNA